MHDVLHIVLVKNHFRIRLEVDGIVVAYIFVCKREGSLVHDGLGCSLALIEERICPGHISSLLSVC